MKIYLFCEELHSVGSVHTEQLRKQIKLMSEMGAASGQIRSMKLQDCSRMQRLKHMMRSCTSFWWLRGLPGHSTTSYFQNWFQRI
ncbi:uncharacterized protein LOC121988772 isoform X5 [Zingiber officinale]|uniref:uncharacterized protein LOC121988771 isoform X3 n=1 Tax=Zingiber officinale TaxID=94328 RepID=UPI001C4C3B12|nr:uncharacterized protein LOC121988771 isoform X3 [Zingiber officinale]XP_042398358.1 uncharacterized protein LOC121988772 isoform X5 [Zingiber officinale]